MKIRLLFILLVLCTALGANTVDSLYAVSVDTTSIAGQAGDIWFVLSSPDVPPLAFADVFNVTLPDGTLNAVPAVNLSTSATQLLDYADMPAVFGSALYFRLDLLAQAVTYPLANGATFSMYLYNPDGAVLINSENGGGPILTIDLTDTGNFVAAPFNSSIIATAVPEPGFYGLTAFALGALFFLRRRRCGNRASN